MKFIKLRVGKREYNLAKADLSKIYYFKAKKNKRPPPYEFEKNFEERSSSSTVQQEAEL
jgi:hypothetical protein